MGVIEDVIFRCGSVIVEIIIGLPEEVIVPEVTLQLQVAADAHLLPPFDGNVSIDTINVWPVTNQTTTGSNITTTE